MQARAPKGAHLVKCFFKWFFQNNVFSQISPRIQSFLRSIVFHNLKNLTFSVWTGVSGELLLFKSQIFSLKVNFFSFFQKRKVCFVHVKNCFLFESETFLILKKVKHCTVSFYRQLFILLPNRLSPFFIVVTGHFFSTLFARTIARISCSLLARVFFKFLQISSNFFKFL